MFDYGHLPRPYTRDQHAMASGSGESLESSNTSSVQSTSSGTTQDSGVWKYFEKKKELKKISLQQDVPRRNYESNGKYTWRKAIQLCMTFIFSFV